MSVFVLFFVALALLLVLAVCQIVNLIRVFKHKGESRALKVVLYTSAGATFVLMVVLYIMMVL